MYQQIILGKILDYCKKVDYPIKKSGSVIMLACPYCSGNELSASVIPNTSVMNCLKCSRKFTLIDLVQEYECKNDSKEEILEYIKDLLVLDVQTKKDSDELMRILDRYEKENFCLVPCAKKDKNPVQNGWTEKENRNKEEWITWITNGLNIGVRTGSVSGITVIDLDMLTKAEKIELVKETTSPERKKEIIAKRKIPENFKTIMGDPWIQETLGGFHLFYKYIDLPKCRIPFENYFVDLENDGGQVIVEPAPEVAVKEEYIDSNEVKRKKIVGYASRKFINNNEMPKMPESLEKMLRDQAPAATYEDNQTLAEAHDALSTEMIRLNLLDDGDGRNSFFTSLGGYLLKRMTPDQVEYTLHGLNPRLCKTPLDTKEIRAMVRSMRKYDDSFQTKLEREIIEYLKLAETASKTDIEIAVLGSRAKGEEKKRIDETVVRLIRERKLLQKGRYYKLLEDMNWSDTITDVGVPIDFKVPYFHDYAHFNWGDIILIGAMTKVGKTAIAMNIVKRLVDQGIKPYYVYSENGARFKNKALALGMGDGSFWKDYCDSVDGVQFKKGHNVTIWDWIDPPDFAKTNVTFGDIARKIEQAQGLLIAFVQLKEGTNGQEPGWFAPNMIRQRIALASKFLYDSNDGTYGKFKLGEIRESKVKGKVFEIPTVYNWETQELCTQEEMDLKKEKKDGD